jgi:hypothetical protein
LHMRNTQDVEAQLQNFWEWNVNVVHHANEEWAAEDHFIRTTMRSHRPLHSKAPSSTKSGSIRWLIQERRTEISSVTEKLSKKSQLREDYTNFIKEYLQLGHMRPVSSETSVGEVRRNNIFLPHHAVLKPDSKPNKTRVVFDASAKWTSGVTLNDILMIGPTIQRDLLSIVLRFRTHVYAMMADISKMYRQIKIHPEDYNLSV